jgi:hypothetical protein
VSCTVKKVKGSYIVKYYLNPHNPEKEMEINSEKPGNELMNRISTACAKNTALNVPLR